MKHLLLTVVLSAASGFCHAAFVDVDLPGTTFVFGTIAVDGTGLFGPGDTLYFEPLAGAYGAMSTSRRTARRTSTARISLPRKRVSPH